MRTSSIILILAALTGCKQTEKPAKEIDLQGCKYHPVMYYNSPALQHSDKCTAPAHPFSEIIFLNEYFNQ